jgi:hypothetical protein
LFHRWEGKKLTDKHWKPMGIAMEAKPALGERRGGLQAPHVVRHGGLYHMAYGDWDNICFATSRDGKHFERVVQPNGKTAVFTEGPRANTRDPMLIKIDGLWHCYYTAFPNGRGYGYCRTSPDLKTWSDSFVVSYGGKVGPGACDNECPQVVEPEPGLFFYLRNENYGANARNWVYASRNPRNFGIDDDSKLVRDWHLAAPEIIHHDGKYYIAALLDSLKGIKIAKLKWVRVPELGEAVFEFDSPDARKDWSLKSGDLPSVFTTSQRTDFGAKTAYFISTGEIGGNRFSDRRTGVIESPAFTINANRYILLVSGGKDRANLCVSLVESDTNREICRLTGDDSNRFVKKKVNCARWRGKRAFIRIVDQSTRGWGHINFGGIYADPLEPYER